VAVFVPTSTPFMYAVIRIVADESQPYSSGAYRIETAFSGCENPRRRSAA
jgi:hypothetical protein